MNHGTRRDIANKVGWTPIYALVIYGHVKVGRVLLNRGARMDIANKYG